MSMRNNGLIKVQWFLSSQLGVDLLRLLRSLRGLPAFWQDFKHFRKNYSGRLNLMPCLHDRYEEGGSTKDEYFWQDLLVARRIFEAGPRRHIDVGSRVDGFVAHVASFRELEVFDVRPIRSRIPGVRFRQMDMMQPAQGSLEEGCCDSLSCLHAIEHFGLGRYGDPVEPNGYVTAIANMARILQPGGRLYLSTPIGQERVEFNAHRVFNPHTIIRLAERNGLQLKTLTVVGKGGGDNAIYTVDSKSQSFVDLAAIPDSLGIFIFTKTGGAM